MESENAGHWIQAGYKISSNVLGWFRFGYTCLVKVVVIIIQNVLLNVPVGPGRAWCIVVNTLDEMRDNYESDVVDNIPGLQSPACAGDSLKMWLTNPWAMYVCQQCLAANTAVEVGVDVALGVFNLAPFAQCMYFQACWRTSLCRAKCNGTWAAFEASLAGAAPSTETSTVCVESLFFPTLSADWRSSSPPGPSACDCAGGPAAALSTPAFLWPGPRTAWSSCSTTALPPCSPPASTGPWPPRSSGSSPAAGRGPTTSRPCSSPNSRPSILQESLERVPDMNLNMSHCNHKNHCIQVLQPGLS